jgi:3-hydroxyisobutyrate dehydrogenase
MYKIGIVGTGIMSRGMAHHFLKAGHHVYIWNRTVEKTVDLQASGAVLCDTPAAVAKAADVIFEVTANDESSQAVWQGADGILAGASENKMLITSATLTADWVDTLHELCEQQGYTCFDMPLTGGRVAAESGSLTMLVGGNKEKLAGLEPTLKAISSKVFYFGKAGSGMRYKLILNTLQATHLVAFGESMKLAKQQGLDTTQVSAALIDRPGGVVTQIAATAYPLSDIPLTFSVDWIAKDLAYARQMAGDLSVPLLDEVLAAYESLREAGAGNQDWATVIQER